MENREALSKFAQVSSVMSRPDMSMLYQRDFEVYMMALELADSDDNMIDYFAFPVMPDSIAKTENQIVNTKKTMNGVTVLTTNTNSIQSISIKGDFGRNFKILLNPKQPSVLGYAFSIDSGKYDQYSIKSNALSMTFPLFFNGITTGFGALNRMRAIISKSTGVDRQGNPFRLYFYNMAMGEAYLITTRPEGITVSQNKDRNMIWGYNATFDILAPLELVRNGSGISSSVKAVAFASLQRDLNNKLRQIKTIL